MVPNPVLAVCILINRSLPLLSIHPSERTEGRWWIDWNKAAGRDKCPSLFCLKWTVSPWVIAVLLHQNTFEWHKQNPPETFSSRCSDPEVISGSHWASRKWTLETPSLKDRQRPVRGASWEALASGSALRPLWLPYCWGCCDRAIDFTRCRKQWAGAPSLLPLAPVLAPG